MTNFMTKAHQLARQIKADENIRRYHTALSMAMKSIYATLKMDREAANMPKEVKQFIIKNAVDKGHFFLLQTKNKVVGEIAKDFSYKSSLINIGTENTFGTYVLSFRNETINNLKN